MQQRSEETRNNLLKAALVTFSKSGYQGTGVAEICQAAGVSKGAFYHHFPSKQAIFLELLENWLAEIDNALFQAKQQADNVPQAILQMTTLLQQVFRDARGRLPMFLEFWTQAARDETVWQSTIDPYRRYQAFFSALLQKGIQEGTVKEIDPEEGSRMIVSLALGFLLQGLLDPDGTDWYRSTQEGIKILLKGIIK